MTRAVSSLLALCILTPGVLAQRIPPPQNPAEAKATIPPQGPALVPPQNAAQNPPAAQPAKKNAGKPVGKPPEFFAARRQAQRDRKQAQLDRMRQFKAARAAEQERLYQDWHERYLADAPVRVEYYRALAAAYQSQPAYPYYYPGPFIIQPIVYAPVIYTPIYQPPIYGTFFHVW
jgi:hypothetical protein